MNSDTTVWTTRRLRGRDKLCVHTDEACDRLSRASNKYEHTLDELGEYRVCKFCANTIEYDTSDTYSLYRLLDNCDPEVFGLSPLAEREQSQEASD